MRATLIHVTVCCTVWVRSEGVRWDIVRPTIMLASALLVLSIHLQRTTADPLGIKRYDFVKAFVRANPAVGKRILPVGMGGWVSMTSGEFLFPIGSSDEMFALGYETNTCSSYSLSKGRVKLNWVLNFANQPKVPRFATDGMKIADKGTLMATLARVGMNRPRNLTANEERALDSTAQLATFVFTGDCLVYFVSGPGSHGESGGNMSYGDKMFRLPTSDLEKSLIRSGAR